ncbi:unnamed protein product [Phaeothamnion confervicola]
MFVNTSAVYGLKLPCRCIAAMGTGAESAKNDDVGGAGEGGEPHLFLVGTTALREGASNELHRLAFQEDTNEIICEQAFSHPGEIWALAPSRRDPSLLFTCANVAGGGGTGEGVGSCLTRLWRMPEDTDNGDGGGGGGGGGTTLSPRGRGYSVYGGGAGGGDSGDGLKQLELKMELCDSAKPLRAVLWSPHGGDDAVTIGSDRLKNWSLTAAAATATGAGGGAPTQASMKGSAAVSSDHSVRAGAWDPHNANAVAVAVGCDVRFWDLRSMKQSHQVSGAHSYGVRDVDYNPHKPHTLATCGEDRLLRFWDLRKPEKPLRSVLAHTHWAWTVRYNKFHDQLLLSGGSDGMVNLWRISSISSAPLLELEDGDIDVGGGAGHHGAGGSGGGNMGRSRLGGRAESADIKVRSFEGHEESVYSVAWSARDPWLFASLSYDGRITVDHVPSTEKYKILL